MHPVQRKYYYFGKSCNRVLAIQTAKALNLQCAPKSSIFDRIVGAATARTFQSLVEVYEREVLPSFDLAASTLQQRRSYLRALVAKVGDWNVAAVTTMDVAEFLKIVSTGDRAKQAYRQVLIDLFRTAVEQGWRDDNPVEATRKPHARRKRQRLTKAQFDAIYACSPDFLRNAMDLAVITLQRRDDVASLRWDSVREADVRIEQNKTGKRLAIGIDARLRSLLERCQDRISSPFVIHRLPDRIKAREQRCKDREHHTQVMPEMITRAFDRARDQAGINEGLPEGETPPTFHEIRSLGADLYRQAGRPENWIQKLLGHEDIDMTRHYLKGHSRPWESVSCEIDSVPRSVTEPLP